ncbi:DUF5677 domain-containing protein [Conexibacter arvalis]|uniref:DUF5677 domain-containing protein n=1 Tax=Conexibacter arvalis TaxID=912552 RepID=UPI00160F5A61
MPTSLTTLGIPAIRIDTGHLSETDDRGEFDELGWQMLARAGRLCQLLVEKASRRSDGTPIGLTLDEAVIGGLLVRVGKLTRAIFDSTQADGSEAHSPLSRCLGETAITLRWLVWKSDPISYRRFRADSFARWRAWLQRAAATSEDGTARQLRQGIENHIAAELKAAGLSWDDVPSRPNSWGPDVRRRFEDLDQYWLYEALFVSHSTYVHPTWNELRAFHLASAEGELRLDSTYAGIAPIAAFVLSRLVAEACLDAMSVLPHDLDTAAFSDVAKHTVRASQHLCALFSEFAARGGLDDDLRKHYSPT